MGASRCLSVMLAGAATVAVACGGTSRPAEALPVRPTPVEHANVDLIYDGTDVVFKMRTDDSNTKLWRHVAVLHGLNTLETAQGESKYSCWCGKSPVGAFTPQWAISKRGPIIFTFDSVNLAIDQNGLDNLENPVPVEDRIAGIALVPNNAGATGLPSAQLLRRHGSAFVLAMFVRIDDVVYHELFWGTYFGPDDRRNYAQSLGQAKSFSGDQLGPVKITLTPGVTKFEIPGHGEGVAVQKYAHVGSRAMSGVPAPVVFTTGEADAAIGPVRLEVPSLATIVDVPMAPASALSAKDLASALARSAPVSASRG